MQICQRFFRIKICKKSSTQAGLREIEERDSSIQNKNNKVEIDSPFQINQRTKHSKEKVFGKNNEIYCDVKLQVAPTELDSLELIFLLTVRHAVAQSKYVLE